MTKSNSNRIATAAMLLALALPVPAAAHGGGSIKLSARQVQSGATLAVKGEGLPPNSSVRLELRSALKTTSFGRVSADQKGVFTQVVRIPVDAGNGNYTIVAVASDGDVAGRADLTIMGQAPAAIPGMDTMPGTKIHETGGMPNMSSRAMGEYMDVPLTTTRWGWVVISLLVAASAGTGIYLIRRTGP